MLLPRPRLTLAFSLPHAPGPAKRCHPASMCDRIRMTRNTAQICSLSALAILCGCGPLTPAGESDDASTDTGSSASSTAPTSGTEISCLDVTLPHGLPAGTTEVYWGWDSNVLTIYLMEKNITCDSEFSCPTDSLPGFLGYAVTLGPDVQSPGVHPIAGTKGPADQVWVGVITLEGGCDYAAQLIAGDGVVEVLALDDNCVAIDIRDVTTAPAGLNPNGSGRASRCP
jgi:hypothetical protein